MRIGIMMRSADEVGGISVYARNIVEELLKSDPVNEYILFYNCLLYTSPSPRD